MSKPSPPTQRKDFEIAIICALRSEADAVEAAFDIFWDDDGKRCGKATGDPNAYTTGVIASHNVVLAYMPSMGKGSAASVASSFRSSFEGIKLALVVGICGGVPYGTDDEKEILLGDVIISDGLIQYDFGRQLPNEFIRKDTLQYSLGRPNTEIRALLAKLKGHRSRMRLKDNTSDYLTHVQQNLGVETARYPGVDADKLFEPPYRHKHHDLPTCTLCTECEKKEDEVCQAALDSSCLELKCNENRLVPRQRLIKAKETSTAPNPIIHYGLIASGDTVMKSGEDRDTIANRDNVIAFEMEGAGVWDNLPCVIIKGVCDYADSHKNKEWQDYAAATAAACMKAFLKEWVSADKSLATNRIPSSNSPDPASYTNFGDMDSELMAEFSLPKKPQKGQIKAPLGIQKRAQRRNKKSICPVHCLFRILDSIPAQMPLIQEPVTFFDPVGGRYPIHLDNISSLRLFLLFVEENIQRALDIRYCERGVSKIKNREFFLRDLHRNQTIDLRQPWQTIMRPGDHFYMSIRFERQSIQTNCPNCGYNQKAGKNEAVNCEKCGVVCDRVVELEDELENVPVRSTSKKGLLQTTPRQTDIALISDEDLIHCFRHVSLVAKAPRAMNTNLQNKSTLLTCNAMWEKIQACSSVQNGNVGIDELCSQLQFKAKCSVDGPVIREEDFQEIIHRLLRQLNNSK